MSIVETRKMADELRAYLNSADQTNDPQVAALAQSYARTCREVNDRLQRCADALEKGHRPEAIAIAEAEPDLLAMVSILTFPELDVWQDVVANYGWERFQPLKHDVAEAVSVAYALEQQLGELLTEHRRLAICQAPLRDRLATMRQIADIDVTTAFWKDDIVTFEGRRYAELEALGSAAVDRGGRPQVERFIAEYEAEDWRSPVPGDLESAYRRVFTAHTTKSVLPDMAVLITQAMSRLDLAQARALRGEWESAVGRLREVHPAWQPPQSLLAAVQPAFAHLDQDEQNARYAAFQNDLAQLQQAMRQEASAEQVTFLLAMVESHGYELPEIVLAELADFRRGATEAKALSVAVIVVLVVAGLAGLVFAYFMFKETAQ